MLKNFGEKYDKRIVLCLGFFDSVHLAHRQLIRRAQEIAMVEHAEVMVFTFLNNPFEGAKKLIYSYRERQTIFEEMGVDCVLGATAGAELFSLTPDEYEAKLVDTLNIAAIVVGADYTYGSGSLGTAETLRENMSKRGIRVAVIDLVMRYAEKVSSSRIRELLADGNISMANELLSSPYFIDGFVKKGRGVGSKIGFPTLNIFADEDKIVLREGVYFTRTICHGIACPGISNVGTHPTFDEYTFNIETHLLPECMPDYTSAHTLPDKGDELRVQFLAYLRSTQKFANAEQLIDTIHADEMYVKNKYFGR